MLYHAGAKLSQEVLQEQEQGIIMGYMQSRPMVKKLPACTTFLSPMHEVSTRSYIALTGNFGPGKTCSYEYILRIEHMVSSPSRTIYV